jgi:hypothetical protein
LNSASPIDRLRVYPYSKSVPRGHFSASNDRGPKSMQSPKFSIVPWIGNGVPDAEEHKRSRPR